MKVKICRFVEEEIVVPDEFFKVNEENDGTDSNYALTGEGVIALANQYPNICSVAEIGHYESIIHEW